MSAPTWDEVKPRFVKMILAVGFRQAAKKIGRVKKSTLYIWFKGSGRTPGSPPVVPSPKKLRAVVRFIERWEVEFNRVRNLKPAPVWSPPRWTNEVRRNESTGGMVYR